MNGSRRKRIHLIVGRNSPSAKKGILSANDRWKQHSIQNFLNWLKAPGTRITAKDRIEIADIIDRLNRRRTTGDSYGEERRTRKPRLPDETILQADKVIEGFRAVLGHPKKKVREAVARKLGIRTEGALKQQILRAKRKKN
jgi:hypothetical protein